MNTFLSIFKFEINYWLKSMMVWVFLSIITLLMVSMLLSDQDIIQTVFFGSALRNSAFAIQRLYSTTAVFGCLMVTAFVNAAASRDFSSNTQQLIFTKPISKFGYLSGRFLGSLLVSMIPMMGASLAVIIAESFYTDDPLWGPRQWYAHMWSILVIALPNTFFIAAIVFSIAVWTRSALASFIGILGLLVALTVASALVVGLDNRMLAALVDPFADTALAQQTEYWTVEDKNTLTAQLTGALLYNRILWTLVGAAFFAAGYFRFSFTTEESLLGRWWRLARTAVEDSTQQLISSTPPPQRIPEVTRQFDPMARFRQWWHLVQTEVWQTVRSPIFICILLGALFVVFTNLSVQTSPMFGMITIPVTFNMVEVLRGTLFQFQLALITFYAGVFVWKERDARLDEIYDALPIPTGLTFLAKLTAMYLVIVAVAMIGIVCALSYQMMRGFYDFQLGLYFTELLGWDLVQITCLIALAFFAHVISPNKYVGYFLYIGLFVANGLVWSLTEVSTRMVRFGDLPGYVYSDLFGREPYLPMLRWFAAYWLLFAGLMAIATILLWPRGRERGKRRLKMAAPRFVGATRLIGVANLLLWLAVGGWVFWNTMILNTLRSPSEDQQAQALYEKENRSLAERPQPRVSHVSYQIDLYPEQRKLDIQAQQTLINQTEEVVDEIYVTASSDYDIQVEIEGAKLKSKDDTESLWTYAVDPPMQPHDTRTMKFQFHYQPHGFENSLTMSAVVENGTFFNTGIMPQVGYQKNWELKEKEDREEEGLEGLSYVSLDPENLAARQNTYISNNSDWVDVETVFSTSGDQLAIAPGSLVERWEKDGRNYFRYKLDHPSLNFYSFISARYKVAIREMGDVNLEVYYHPDHEWNVDIMLRSMEASLKYYTENFGPYYHQQARIVEFPRVATFAQAFPGTMPYSEGIGFIADLEDLKNEEINMVSYVVAHEIAHQWWAHQVIGADMQGATVLSETLAQYSALMVMEREFGRDMMRKFLQYEMDNYLRARGRTSRPEQPLQSVEPDQGYIHYNKGSLAMYLLKETIGEEKVNQALQALVQRFAYQGPPYPTSLDLVEELRKVTPEEHQSLIDDLFERITLFDNRTLEASYKKVDGGYEVTLTAQFKKLVADSKGKEEEVALNDWIEIGAFAYPNKDKEVETLYRERLHISESPQTFTFKVDKKPAKVGVDPISLLIDRNKADNMIEPGVD